MKRRSKQKSCFPCANGKRRCDRTLPSCSRCADRAVECVYPLPRDQSDRVCVDGFDIEPANDAGVTLQVPIDPRAHDESGARVVPSTNSRNASGSKNSMPTSLRTSSESASTSLISPAQPSSSTSVTSSLLLPSGDLRWFTPPSTWEVVHHYQPPDTVPSPQAFSEFIRGLGTWLARFRREGHNPFIHRLLYPPRAIPDCIQDAYAAIAVSEGGNAENENIIDYITFSYATRLLAQHTTLVDQSIHMITVKDHLARTQALLIHFLLALTSSSISRQTRADGFIDTLHRWKTELLASAVQESSVAQLFPCSPSLGHEGAGPDNNPIPDLHRAFVICESIRRTWLLCSVAIGLYRSLRGDWTVVCGGDIRFTARASLWAAPSSAVWANAALKTDPLFEYSLRGEDVAKRGVPAMEVDEFARHLFSIMLGTDKVESWVFRTGNPGSGVSF